MAIFGLIASPVSAKIAQMDCGVVPASSSETKSLSADKMKCCDKADKSSKTEKSKACASNCAAMCGVTVSLESPATYHMPLLATVALVFTLAPGAVPSHLVHFDDPPPRLTT